MRKTKARPRAVSRKSSPDPVVKLIAIADKRIAEYTEAAKIESELATTLGEDDARAPSVQPPTEFRHNLPSAMASEEFIKRSYRGLGKRLRQRIQHYRSALRKNPGSPIRLETSEHLEADKKLLSALPYAEKTTLTAFRKKRARVNNIWRSTGYGKARDRLHQARWLFQLATFNVANAQPTTLQDAMALVKYAAERATPAKSLPWSAWNFMQLSKPLRQAHDVLVKKAA
jgi:hypothetical protein